MTENDLKKELRREHGTACYVCAQLKPRMSDVVVMMFRPEKIATLTPENTYLCCKSCAVKIRNRPISAYATEQMMRLEMERVRLGQLSQWHNVERIPTACPSGVVPYFRGSDGGLYVRGWVDSGRAIQVKIADKPSDIGVRGSTLLNLDFLAGEAKSVGVPRAKFVAWVDEHGDDLWAIREALSLFKMDTLVAPPAAD